jgi:hypothetical protein
MGANYTEWQAAGTRLARAICIYIYGVYPFFGRDITKYTVIYGVHIQGSGQPYAGTIIAAEKVCR